MPAKKILASIKMIGSYHGINRTQKYKNYQIEECHLLGVIYHINSLHIRKLKDNDGNITYFWYHMYDTNHLSPIEQSGRWYNSDLPENSIQIDKENRTLTHIIPLYENTDTQQTFENVPMIIKFNGDGWNQLMELIA